MEDEQFELARALLQECISRRLCDWDNFKIIRWLYQAVLLLRAFTMIELNCATALCRAKDIMCFCLFSINAPPPPPPPLLREIK